MQPRAHGRTGKPRTVADMAAAQPAVAANANATSSIEADLAFSRVFVQWCADRRNLDRPSAEAIARVIKFATSCVTLSHVMAQGFNDLAQPGPGVDAMMLTRATNRLATIVWALDREYAVGNGLALPDGTPLVDDEKSKEDRLALRTSALSGATAVGFAVLAVREATNQGGIPDTVAARQQQLTRMWTGFKAGSTTTGNIAAASAVFGEQWRAFANGMHKNTLEAIDVFNEYKVASASESIVNEKPAAIDFVKAARAALKGGGDDKKGGGGGGGGGPTGQGQVILINAFSDLQTRNAQLSCAIAFLNRRLAVANWTITGLADLIAGNDDRATQIRNYIAIYSASGTGDALQTLDATLAREYQRRAELMHIVMLATMQGNFDTLAQAFNDAINCEYNRLGAARDSVGQRGRDWLISGGDPGSEAYMRYVNVLGTRYEPEPARAAARVAPPPPGAATPPPAPSAEQKKKDDTELLNYKLCAVQHARECLRLLILPSSSFASGWWVDNPTFVIDNPMDVAQLDYVKAIRAVFRGRRAEDAREIERVGNEALGVIGRALGVTNNDIVDTSDAFCELYRHAGAAVAVKLLDEHAGRTTYITALAAAETTLKRLHATFIAEYKKVIQTELRESPRANLVLHALTHMFGEARLIDRVFQGSGAGQASVVKLWKDYFGPTTDKGSTVHQVLDIITDETTSYAEQSRIFGEAELKWGQSAVERKTEAELRVDNDMRVREVEAKRAMDLAKTFQALLGVCISRANHHAVAMGNLADKLIASVDHLRDIEPGEATWNATEVVEKAEALRLGNLTKFPFAAQIKLAATSVASVVEIDDVRRQRFASNATDQQILATAKFDTSVSRLAAAVRYTHVRDVAQTSVQLLVRLWANAASSANQLTSMTSMLETVAATLGSVADPAVPDRLLHMDRAFTAAMEQRNIGDILQDLSDGLTDKAERKRAMDQKDMKWTDLLGSVLKNASDVQAAFAATEAHATAERIQSEYRAGMRGYTDAATTLTDLVKQNNTSRIGTDEVARSSGSMRLYLASTFKQMLEYLGLTVAQRKIPVIGAIQHTDPSLVKRLGDMNREFEAQVQRDMADVKRAAERIASDASNAVRTVENSLLTSTVLAEQVLQLRRQRASTLAYVRFQSNVIKVFCPAQLAPHTPLVDDLYLAPKIMQNFSWRPQTDEEFDDAHGEQVGAVLLYLFRCIDRAADFYLYTLGQMGPVGGKTPKPPKESVPPDGKGEMEADGDEEDRKGEARDTAKDADTLWSDRVDEFKRHTMTGGNFVADAIDPPAKWATARHDRAACALECGMRILAGKSLDVRADRFLNYMVDVGNSAQLQLYGDTFIGIWTSYLWSGTDAEKQAEMRRIQRTVAGVFQHVTDRTPHVEIMAHIRKLLQTAANFVDLVRMTRNTEGGVFVKPPNDKNLPGFIYRAAWGISRPCDWKEELDGGGDGDDAKEVKEKIPETGSYDKKREAVLRGLAHASFVSLKDGDVVGRPIEDEGGHYADTPPLKGRYFFPLTSRVANNAHAARWAFPDLTAGVGPEKKRQTWQNAEKAIMRGWDLIARLRALYSAMPSAAAPGAPTYPEETDARVAIIRGADARDVPKYLTGEVPTGLRTIKWKNAALPSTAGQLQRTIETMAAFEVGLMQEDQKVTSRSTPLKEITRKQANARAQLIREYITIATGGMKYWHTVLEHMRVDGMQYAGGDVPPASESDMRHVDKLAEDMATAAGVVSVRVVTAIQNLTAKVENVDTQMQIALGDLKNSIGRWVFAQSNGFAISLRESLRALRNPPRVSNRWSLYGEGENDGTALDAGLQRSVLALMTAPNATASGLLRDLENAIEVGGVGGMTSVVKSRETELYRQAKEVIEAHAEAIGPGSVLADVRSANATIAKLREVAVSQGMVITDPSISGLMRDTLALLERLVVVKRTAMDASGGWDVSVGAGGGPAAGARGGRRAELDDSHAEEDDTGSRHLARAVHRAPVATGEYARLEVIASGDAQRDWLICRLARWLTIVQGDARIDRVTKMIHGGGLHISNGFVYFNSSTEYAGLVHQHRHLREKLRIAQSHQASAVAREPQNPSGIYAAQRTNVDAELKANQAKFEAAQKEVADVVEELQKVAVSMAASHDRMDQFLDRMMDEIRGRLRGWKYQNGHGVIRDKKGNPVEEEDESAVTKAPRVPNDYGDPLPEHDPVLYDAIAGADVDMRGFDLVLYYLLSPEVYSALSGVLQLLSTCPGALKAAHDKLKSEMQKRHVVGSDRKLVDWMAGNDHKAKPPMTQRDTSLTRLFAAILFDDQLALLSAYLMSATLQGMVLTSTGMGGDAKADAVARAKITQRYRLLQHNIETYTKANSLTHT